MKKTAQGLFRSLVGPSSIDPVDYKKFWREYREEDSHLNPTLFYKNVLSKHQRQDRVIHGSLYNNNTYDPSTTLRFVCVSDTHGVTDQIHYPMPKGDVLLHAGSFSQVGDGGGLAKVNQFADWLDSLPYSIKIVIAGNSDIVMDPVMAARRKVPPEKNTREKAITRLQKSCTYLEDSSAVVNGIKIFGTPWVPDLADCSNIAFNMERGEGCVKKWKEVPSDTDILLTHAPPIGHGDGSHRHLNVRLGSVDLLQEIQLRIKPKYHVFGHVHEARGITTDGQTVFINPCTCSITDRPIEYPIMFDMDKKSDVTVLESASPEWNVKDPRKLDGYEYEYQD